MADARPDPSIVVVDDEPQIRRFLRAALAGQGYRVHEASTGADGLVEVASRQPDVVILDLGLPDMDGLDVIRKVREWSAVPVIVLSARGQEADKVAALDAGADDYVQKPFGIDELLARLRALLRRATPSGEPVLEVGELVIDLEKRLVTVGGRRVQLTPNEFDLLRVLAQNEGKLMTHSAILRDVWGPAYSTESHYLHVYVSQLRRKLEDDPARPRYLLTEAGAGYRLVNPVARS